MVFARKTGGKLARGKRDGLQLLVVVAKCAANIGTQIAGVLHRNFIARLQCTSSNGVIGKALVSEPIIERTHPTGIIRSVLFLNAVNGANVPRIGTFLLVSSDGKCINNAAHHR